MLVNLYNSLVKQTSMDFCWIIVDDGSKDNTKEVVNNWIKEGIIDIKYYYQENAGKMKAHNNGVKHTETELFLCVDSDDYLTSDAVEQIINTWNNYRNNNMAGIIAYKKLLNCPEMNSVFPEKIEISSLSDLYNNGFVGETALVFNTSVIKQYLFPEIDGEKFIRALLLGNGVQNYIKIGEKQGLLFRMSAHNLILDGIMAWGIIGMGSFLIAIKRFVRKITRVFPGKHYFTFFIPLFSWFALRMIGGAFTSFSIFIMIFEFIYIAYSQDDINYQVEE